MTQTSVRITRESVAAGDDWGLPYELRIFLKSDATLEDVVEHLKQAKYLPTVVGQNHTWHVVVDGQTVASFRANFDHPCNPEALNQSLADFADGGLVKIVLKYQSAMR